MIHPRIPYSQLTAKLARPVVDINEILRLDGTVDDYAFVESGDLTNADFSGAGSWMGWYYFNTVIGVNNVMQARWDFAGNELGFIFWTNTTAIQLRIADLANNQLNVSGTPSVGNSLDPLIADEWRWIGATWLATPGTMQLYVDGVPMGVPGATWSALNPGLNRLLLGADEDETVGCDGDQAYVRAYEIELTAAEMLAESQSKVALLPNPAYDLPFVGLTDQGNNANDITLNGTASLLFDLGPL